MFSTFLLNGSHWETPHASAADANDTVLYTLSVKPSVSRSLVHVVPADAASHTILGRRVLDASVRHPIDTPSFAKYRSIPLKPNVAVAAVQEPTG